MALNGLSTSAVCWILTYFLKLADQLTQSNCYWGKYMPTQVSKVNKFYRCYHFLPFTEIDRFEWYDATWNVLKIIIRRNLKIHISENFQQTFASSSAWHWKSQFQFENRLLYNFCTESDVIIEWDVIQFENLCWKSMNFEVNDKHHFAISCAHKKSMNDFCVPSRYLLTTKLNEMTKYLTMTSHSLEKHSKFTCHFVWCLCVF